MAADPMIDKVARAVAGGGTHELRWEDRPGRIHASLAGEVVFDTRRAKTLYEGRLRPRVYVPVEDLNRDVLEPTGHSTHCPFKGDASYWSIRAGDRIEENAVWTYTEPKKSASYLKGYACVYPEKVDEWDEGSA